MLIEIRNPRQRQGDEPARVTNVHGAGKVIGVGAQRETHIMVEELQES